jgi:hypothetical protein
VFEASGPFLLFDYFRIPYRIIEPTEGADDPLPHCGELRWNDGGDTRSLYWARADEIERGGLGRREFRRLGSILLDGLALDHGVAADWLAASGTSWRELVELRDRRGRSAGAICQDANGNLFLPFDPGDVIESFWRERYRAVSMTRLASRARMFLAGLYYRLRPAIPRAAQIALRRRVRRLQTHDVFPAWPIETALHDFYDLLFGLIASVARQPIPSLAPWPGRYEWALVLTHDVETRKGYENLGRLREVEAELGYRSAWNFVPRRYDVDDERVRELVADGFEVGVHGLYHDGRDLERSVLPERVRGMRAAAERWQARGFRSPALRRDADVISMLGFEHDSSFPDTDPFGPDGGGCCTWLPFALDDLVELPVTLAQDHTLFEILQHTDGQAWFEKTDYLRGRGGMALLITHPDYMRDERRLAAYADFLRAYRDDATVWRALPCDVAAWWRRRAASSLVLEDGRWRVVGPAAGEARIRFLSEADANSAAARLELVS